jgi:uncharacterized repeat protein (TIGR01451 family)
VLRKVSNKRVVHGGDTIRFTITIRARGTGTATNARVCDTLPPGLVFVRAPGATFSGGRLAGGSRASRPVKEGAIT